MATIHNGRMTHRYDGELVIFLIGMRVNKPWRPDLWLPVFSAMGGMLTELFKNPESGLVGYRMGFSANGPLLVQYWTSHEKLYDYASAPTSSHRPAWSAFNKRARKASGAVGIWHETYQVARAESMYVAMPAIGLGGATELVPVGHGSDGARDRYAAGRVSSGPE